jgi:hypothetical protein
MLIARAENARRDRIDSMRAIKGNLLGVCFCFCSGRLFVCSTWEKVGLDLIRLDLIRLLDSTVCNGLFID